MFANTCGFSFRHFPLRQLRWAALGVLALALPALAETPKRQVPVDLELILAVDISGSIDPDEAKLQREGYVNGIKDPDVVKAMTSGAHGRIAVAYFEWASYWDRRLVMDWALISDTATARAFAATLAERPISIGQRTSIAGAIEQAIPMYEANNYAGVRKVLDISGDGPNNDGGLVSTMRDKALERGITINGLAIINDRPNRWGFPVMKDLDRYYEGCVIGGSGSFVLVAEDFKAFGAAVKRKLVLEIAGAGTSVSPASHGRQAKRKAFAPLPVADYAGGCDIGERQQREYFQRRFSP